MNDEKTLRLQKAMDYIVYMMVGSYFAGTQCLSRICEKKLFLNYKEIGVEKQIKYENECIWFTENVLMKKLPERIWNETVKVNMTPDASGKGTTITFVGEDFKMSVSSDCSNNSRPKLSCTVNGEEISK